MKKYALKRVNFYFFLLQKTFFNIFCLIESEIIDFFDSNKLDANEYFIVFKCHIDLKKFKFFSKIFQEITILIKDKS